MNNEIKNKLNEENKIFSLIDKVKDNSVKNKSEQSYIINSKQRRAIGGK